MRALIPALILVPLVASSGCGPNVDLKQALRVTSLSSGYWDAGVVDGRNKIVPSITLKVEKNTDQSIRPLSLNVVFRKLPLKGQPVQPGTTGEEDWEDVYFQNVRFDGNATQALTVRPKVGYTGDPPQSRADMLKNSQFRDVRVHVYAKHSASQWIEVGQFDLPRQLITAQ
jgi:hypothetical protein